MNCNVSVQCAVYCTVHWLEAAGLVEDVLMGQRPHWHHCHWSPGHVTLTSPSSADCGLTPSWLCFRILLYQRPSPCHPHHGPATAQEGCLQQVHRESPQGEACHRENAIWKLKSLIMWFYELEMRDPATRTSLASCISFLCVSSFCIVKNTFHLWCFFPKAKALKVHNSKVFISI